jgi:hypothetical protein
MEALLKALPYLVYGLVCLFTGVGAAIPIIKKRYLENNGIPKPVDVIPTNHIPRNECTTKHEMMEKRQDDFQVHIKETLKDGNARMSKLEDGQSDMKNDLGIIKAMCKSIHKGGAG